MDYDAKLKSALENGDIREHLRLWQQQQDLDGSVSDSIATLSSNQPNTIRNPFNQSGEGDDLNLAVQEDEAAELEEDEESELTQDESSLDIARTAKFLRKGDLVELA